MEDKFSKRDQELSSLGMKPNFQYESYVFNRQAVILHPMRPQQGWR